MADICSIYSSSNMYSSSGLLLLRTYIMLFHTYQPYCNPRSKHNLMLRNRIADTIIYPRFNQFDSFCFELHGYMFKFHTIIYCKHAWFINRWSATFMHTDYYGIYYYNINIYTNKVCKKTSLHKSLSR